MILHCQMPTLRHLAQKRLPQPEMVMVEEPPAGFEPDGVHVRFWKPYPPAARGGAPARPGDPGGGPRGRQPGVYPGDQGGPPVLATAGGRQEGFCMGSGPGSKNFGPPADVASCVTHPIGFGNCGDEGCRICMRTIPFLSLKAGATCSTISPSCNDWTSGLFSCSVVRTTVPALATFHFFGAKCLGRGAGTETSGSATGAAPYAGKAPGCPG
mmetsp:Transcript_40130/g.128855  ORF Transcript_40130/g.128855 Transcript_40130/m.128855 type:complete len:212 (-) Transcript_40130:860-1495(-)